MKGTRWDQEEVKTLLWYWGQLPPATIAKRVKRTQGAVLEKARRMGLKVRTGNLTNVSTLAVKCGCDRESLYRILKASKVLVHRGPKSSKGRVRYVDEYDGLTAYEAWLSTESVRAAAQRYGTSTHWITRRLRAAGVLTTTVPRGASIRFRPEVVDEAVRRYRR